MHIDQYIFCTKSGRKWIAIAGVTLGPDSCVARAQNVFDAAGYEARRGRVCWGEMMTNQANFGGKSLNYKTLQTPIAELAD